MKQFSGPLRTEKIGRQKWEVLAPFSWPMDLDGNIVIVPEGFITDGASIPRIFWTLIGPPMGGDYDQSAVLHDYFYNQELYTRRRADIEFLLSMRSEGVSWLKRIVMHRAVRTFGWNPLSEYKRDLPF